ncbi:glutamate racemase [Gracilibacillus halophilus YIM-C55.5]|uniref:Glutamate racemase n=1 Tax=Gracilibacillus halophilus YIM-C55.5 TaxID=1308866 RepID=N4WNS0_9BACI|nr:glutamate racemase [Gracilibacillus halophilus]ENH96125.1 glutamate racemase [Gracilibacillus halophilus YIM-C55.5]
MKAPIGVIDSGVGGLTVATELMRQLPKESIIYFGDTKRCPYGPRPKEEVEQFTWQMVRFLLKKQMKMLVVACNTATAFTLEQLRETLDIPVIGVIQPGARAALTQSWSADIGVIGTEGTIKSKSYQQAIHHINANITVRDLACPQFVPIVEQGIQSNKDIYETVYQSLRPLKNFDKMDTLILGCTHYPMLRDVIQEVMGQHISIISSGEETAREVSTILGYHHKLYEGDEPPIHHYFTSGDAIVFRKIATEWMQQPIHHVDSIHLTD